MHTRSWRNSFRSLGLPGLALLPLGVAAVVLAVTASDPPPIPPLWGQQEAGAGFGEATFEFSSVGPQITVKYNSSTNSTDATPSTGYRLYLGLVPRSAGVPFSQGNTPYDLGGSTPPDLILRSAEISPASAKVPFTASPTTPLFLAVTAYNQFGNESDYSKFGTILPISPPTGVSSTGAGTTAIKIDWTPGALPGSVACPGCKLKTEIWRRLANADDSTLVKRFSGEGNTFTDSVGLVERENYLYRLRTFVDISQITATAVDPTTPFTYSTNVPHTARTGQTITDDFPIIVAGNAVGSAGAPISAVDLIDGDIVTVSAGTPGGTVFFNDGPCTPNTYATGPSGVTLDELNPCFTDDVGCASDPIGGSPHAGLFLPAQPGTPIRFLGSTRSETFVYNSGTGAKLRLGVNDVSCGPSPNSGSFNANVRRVRAIFR